MDNNWNNNGIIYIYIWLYLGKFHHDRTLFSRTLGIMVYLREIIPFYGRKIQVSEILLFAHIYIYIYIYSISYQYQDLLI